MASRETHLRSLSKAVGWRLIALFFTTIIAWWMTGSLSLGLGIGFGDFFVKIAGMYLYERVWQRIKFGVADEETVASEGEGI